MNMCTTTEQHGGVVFVGKSYGSKGYPQRNAAQQHHLVLMWRATIVMRMTVKTEQPLQDGGAPKYVYLDRTAWRCAVFVGKRYGSKGMLPMYGENCLSRQAVL